MTNTAVVTALACTALCQYISPPRARASELLITNVTVISAERRHSLNHAFVRIVDNRIVEVSAKKIAAKTGSRTVDGQNLFLIPGLMDSHVHLATMPGIAQADGRPLTPLLALQSVYEKQQPRSYLYHGFTQILDPATTPRAVALFNTHVQRPDLFFCGATPILGGYPTVFVHSDKVAMQFFPYFVAQEIEDKTPPPHIDRQAHTPEQSVARMKRDGAICTKIYVEDGFGDDSGWPLPSKASIARLRRAAHQNGLKLMAHANAYDMQKIAMDMKVDIIAHGMWNWTGASGAGPLPVSIRLMLDKMIAKKTAFQPTANVMNSLRDTVAGINVDTNQYANVTPRKLIDYYMGHSGRWFQRQMLEEFGGLSAEKIYQLQHTVVRQGDKVTKYLADHGGLLLLASDTPPAPVYVSQPGLSGYLEMKHMADIGVSLVTLFAAATLNNARAFNLDKDYGTIEPGKIANLLLLRADPLKNATAYDRIEKIILAGKVIERDSLRANRHR